MSKNILIGVVIVIIIAVGLYYFLVLQKQGTTVARLEQEQGLGSSLYEKTGNPGEVVPETNPFQNVQVNPLEGTNPFEGGYKNPFGE